MIRPICNRYHESSSDRRIARPRPCPPRPGHDRLPAAARPPTAPALDFGGGIADDHCVITVSGQLDGHEVAVRLDDDGQLTGSPALLAAIDELIAHEQRVGIGGIVTGAASLHEDQIARATLVAPLDHGTARLGGDPPCIDRIPVGATP